VRFTHKAHQTFLETYDKTVGHILMAYTAADGGNDDPKRCTGLGIGVSFGDVSIMRVDDNHTVIGMPVVEACRLGTCEAGKSLFGTGALGAIDQLPAIERATRAEEATHGVFLLPKNEPVDEVVKKRYESAPLFRRFCHETRTQELIQAVELVSVGTEPRLTLPFWKA